MYQPGFAFYITLEVLENVMSGMWPRTEKIELATHFSGFHGRPRTEGEIYRFRHPGKKRGGYKATGKSVRAVQGGLPSLGKRK